MSPDQTIRLQEYAQSSGFEIEKISDDAFQGKLLKRNLSFKVTIAHSVLEWYVEIIDKENNLKYENWYDYQGYDETSFSQLAVDMIKDLESCITEITNSKFRLKGKNVCQKKVEGKWEFCNI